MVRSTVSMFVKQFLIKLIYAITFIICAFFYICFNLISSRVFFSKKNENSLNYSIHINQHCQKFFIICSSATINRTIKISGYLSQYLDDYHLFNASIEFPSYYTNDEYISYCICKCLFHLNFSTFQLFFIWGTVKLLVKFNHFLN